LDNSVLPSVGEPLRARPIHGHPPGRDRL